VTIQEVLLQYEGRLTELQSSISQYRLSHALAAGVLTLALGSLLALGLYAVRGRVSIFWLSLPVPLVAASILRLQKTSQAKSQMWRLKRHYQRAVQRVKGNWVRSGFTGEEFSPPGHVYAADLHIVGEGSLFELLCVTRTGIGRRGLANYLLEAPSIAETLLRQDAVRELRDRVDLRERIATLGEFEFLESHQRPFEDWLDSPQLSFAPSLSAIATVTSAVLGMNVVAGLLGILPWVSVVIWISPLIAFHSAVGLFFRTRVNRALLELRPLSLEIHVLREGILLLEAEPFQSGKLRQLAEQSRTAAASLRKLQRLLDAVLQRNKEWCYGPSLVLLAGTQLCIAIEKWRSEHGSSFRMWLHTWAEFEALNALGSYAYENPQSTFPEFIPTGTCYKAQELGHPLLPPASCIVNDVELGPDSRFYILSGSNMSGKSTLLRAVGLNAVLAFAGAPVRARALKLSGLSVVASLSIVDSLLSGTSKFQAEVERLRRAIQSAVPDRPVLFLLDEIFSGTNSRDRRIAAEAVVRTLVNRGAIGILSTHDLALTEIATVDGIQGFNVHMGSRNVNDPMDFDYRLKAGITQETNALAIARMAGVPV
jgi:hypothetical protein